MAALPSPPGEKAQTLARRQDAEIRNAGRKDTESKGTLVELVTRQVYKAIMPD